MTPTHEQLAWAREAHGCVFETADDGYVNEWCETHARMPCRLGDRLAQRVAERDQRIKAEARNRGRRCGCAWCCADVPPDRRGSGHKECS